MSETSGAPRTEFISNLQVLRAWAALSVVFYHTAFVIPGTIHTDFLGVTIFFGISGFIMTHITRENADGFMKARLIRIVPLYWIATLFLVVWTGGGFSNPLYTYPLWAHMLITSPAALASWFGTQFESIFTHHMLMYLARSASFLPKSQPPVLGVGWTLNIEMFFYLVFWISLKINRLYAPFIVSAVLLAFKTWPLCDLGSAGKLYSHGYTTSFIAGILVYYAWQQFLKIRHRIPRTTVWAATFAALCFYLIFSLGLISQLQYLWVRFPRLDSIVGALVVFSALLLHSTGVRITSPLFLLLGNASYALYLFHVNALETLRAMSGKFPWLEMSRNVCGVIAVLVASSLLAVAVHLWIERPILRLFRRILGKPPLVLSAAPTPQSS